MLFLGRIGGGSLETSWPKIESPAKRKRGKFLSHGASGASMPFCQKEKLNAGRSPHGKTRSWRHSCVTIGSPIGGALKAHKTCRTRLGICPSNDRTTTKELQVVVTNNERHWLMAVTRQSSVWARESLVAYTLNVGTRPCRLCCGCRALNAGPFFLDFFIAFCLLHWGCGSDSLWIYQRTCGPFKRKS